ncbi:Hypothetical protein NTJ_15350 [Nesidiocoris tenuis]|uniref:Uncharacterized protein n=1 Tax=Nesidiocoris tenuis TaxID=355587 RepID=A0ABN7BDX2_9HEMI|nr:Hypothetical protein NTJ_15350 [Nesidiocoris tenuis]
MRFDPTIAVQLFLIFPLCTGLLFPVQRASGFDSLIDYALNLVNSKIRNLNDTAIWVPTADLGLPAEVKRVQVYDLSTIHRLGEASLIHSEGYPEQINVTVEVGLSNLIVYLDVSE